MKEEYNQKGHDLPSFILRHDSRGLKKKKDICTNNLENDSNNLDYKLQNLPNQVPLQCHLIKLYWRNTILAVHRLNNSVYLSESKHQLKLSRLYHCILWKNRREVDYSDLHFECYKSVYVCFVTGLNSGYYPNQAISCQGSEQNIKKEMSRIV